MSRYMLDTDMCSYVMKRNNMVVKRLERLAVDDVCISVISKAELLFGIELSPRREQDGNALRAFLQYAEVVDFSDRAAIFYAKVCADLQKRGTMIGANDLFIAAHALSLGLTLVTNNTREFRRVRDLVVENWATKG